MRRPPLGRCEPTRERSSSMLLATPIAGWTNCLSKPLQTLESLALREGKTERSIRMTLSLAFLAPDIVKAAVEGRLPRGFGLKRLVDLPMAWSDQWRALGLEAPA